MEPYYLLCTVVFDLLLIAAAECSPQATETTELRVCADPNNLPFSNAREQGLENELAHLVACDLGRSLHYNIWWAQRRGFLRNTLKAGLGDVVLGVPASPP